MLLNSGVVMIGAIIVGAFNIFLVVAAIIHVHRKRK